ncbi:GPW/gp25 family protein [Candidatus Uabimicrobium amorphum]|uniref:IraD/Gp25-like domain-containing protein n=1 Tax=Uabimicrobium amorphum TaxID=2596890 RepID=A0A5S9IS92_UABAM|nr:GPW/gp25 family protein [Candidatus Uabimicrobium amorphum]BBM86666.1 hypothetical protein UABAM_05052 [Candidatus Uabimicrobium amorphum]
MHFLQNFSERPRGYSELEQVLHNLNHMLSTKRLYGSVWENFGIEDHSCYGSLEVVTYVKNQIQQNIHLYESRITLIDIEEQENTEPFSLHFQITFSLASSTHTASIKFSEGTVSVT